MKSTKSYISLSVWVVSLLLIGTLIGSLTKTEISTWYSSINRSSFTPPNYVFPIAWTILYTILAVCGWLIWKARSFSNLRLIKSLYVMQLILNWCWTPLFFQYHLTGTALVSLLVMDVIVAIIIYLGHVKMRSVSLLLIPYFFWLLFATYLNFYIWQYN